MSLASRWLRSGHEVAALFFLAALSGCATLPQPPPAEAVQLANVPVFVQQELQCGPAALASLLSASGVPTTPEALTADLFIPARKGSLQVELAAQARLRGRVPLLLVPSEQALVTALHEGEPVLVLLNLGVRSAPLWHYAVLTGYDPEQGYTLNAGEARPQVVVRRSFLRQWQGAAQWGLTLHKPDEPPRHAEPAQWITAAAPLQSMHPMLAEQAYRAAVLRWPDAALAWAALGGARFAAGDWPESVMNLRKAAVLEPGDAAIANNLASVELMRGCVNAARAVLAAVDRASVQPAIVMALNATQMELESAGEDRCPD